MEKDSKQPDAGAEQSDTVVDEPAAEGPTSTLRLRLVAALGVLLLVASTASAVFFYLQLDEKQDVDDAHAAASAAACDYARGLGNFDYNNLDPYFGSALEGATGEWKTQFDTRRDDLRNLYTQGQVTSHTTDAQCATLSGDADSAEVLVLVTQSVSSVATEGNPQVGQLTMKVGLDNIDGHWLASKLSAPQML